MREVFRPLPVEAMAGTEPFVRGMVRVRGEALPLVDLNALLGLPLAGTGRYVSLRVGQRSVALAVEAVLGLRDVDRGDLSALPPLLAEAAPAVEALAKLDRELLLLLKAARLLPRDLETAGMP